MKPSRVAAVALAVAAVVATAGCHKSSKPDPTPYLGDRERFTCCNLHYENSEVSDANYWVGETIPAGTAVRIENVSPHSVTILAGETKVTLKHEYGTKQETFEQYLSKVLVTYDPRPRIGQFPGPVKRAIDNGKVERGMTREQVVLSLGHPPAHRTASLSDLEWTYWYNRWSTYRVLFDERGKVSGVVGRPAPTAEVAITDSDARPPDRQKPAKDGGKRGKRS